VHNLWCEKKREYDNYCTKTKPRDSSAHYRRCRVIEPVIDTLRNHRRAILKNRTPPRAVFVNLGLVTLNVGQIYSTSLGHVRTCRTSTSHNIWSSRTLHNIMYVICSLLPLVKHGILFSYHCLFVLWTLLIFYLQTMTIECWVCTRSQCHSTL